MTVGSIGWSGQCRCLSQMLIIGRSLVGRVGKHGQTLLGQAVRELDGIIRVIRTVTLILQLFPLGTSLGTVAAMSRGRGCHHESLTGDLSSQGQSSSQLARYQCRRDPRSIYRSLMSSDAHESSPSSVYIIPYSDKEFDTMTPRLGAADIVVVVVAATFSAWDALGAGAPIHVTSLGLRLWVGINGSARLGGEIWQPSWGFYLS